MFIPICSTVGIHWTSTKYQSALADIKSIATIESSFKAFMTADLIKPDGELVKNSTLNNNHNKKLIKKKINQWNLRRLKQQRRHF